jgi:hypothetical protein
VTRTQQRRLKARFPLVFRKLNLERRMKGSPIGERDIECGPGWYPLVARLARSLEAEIQALPRRAQRGIYCVQVKEKFGGLRFYMYGATPAMREAIQRFEDESFHVCEDCGRPGTLRELRGWFVTLCADHTHARR